MTKQQFAWFALVLAFLLMGLGDSAPWWLAGAVCGVVGMAILIDHYEVKR